MVVDFEPVQRMQDGNLGVPVPVQLLRPEVDEKVRKKIRSTLTASGSGGCALGEFVVNLRQDWHVEAEQLARAAGFSGIVAMLRSMPGEVRCRVDGGGRLMVGVVVSEEIKYNMRHIDDSIKDKEKHRKAARSRPAHRQMPRRGGPPPRPLPMLPAYRPPPQNIFHTLPPPPISAGHHSMTGRPGDMLSNDMMAWLMKAAAAGALPSHLLPPPPSPSTAPVPSASTSRPPPSINAPPGFGGNSANLEPMATLRPEFAGRFGSSAGTRPVVNPQRPMANLGGAGKAPLPANRRGGTGGNSVPLANPRIDLTKKPPLNQLSPSLASGNRYAQMVFDAVDGSPYQYSENEPAFGNKFPAGRGAYSVCQHAYPEQLPRKQPKINSLRERGRPPPGYENSNPPMHSIRSPPPSLAHFELAGGAGTEAFLTDDGSPVEIDVTTRRQDELRYGNSRKQCSQRATTNTLDEWERIPVVAAGCQSIQPAIPAIPPKLHRIVRLLREADGRRLQMKKLEEAYKKRYGCALTKTELIDCLGAKGANNSAAAFQKCAVPNLLIYKVQGALSAVIELKESCSAAAGEASSGSGGMAQSGVKSQLFSTTPTALYSRRLSAAAALNFAPDSPVSPNINCLLRRTSRLSIGSNMGTRRAGSQSTVVHEEVGQIDALKVESPPPRDPSPVPSTSAPAIEPARVITPPPPTRDFETISRAPSVAGTLASTASFASTAPPEEHLRHLLEIITYIHTMLEPSEWMTLSALHTHLTHKYPASAKKHRSLLKSKQQVAGLLATHFQACFKLQARNDGEMFIAKVAAKRPDELVSQLQRIHPTNFRLVEEVLVAGGCYNVTLVKLLNDSLHFTFQPQQSLSRSFLDAQLEGQLTSLAATLDSLGTGSGGNLTPTPTQPILYLTERSRLLRCWVMSSSNLDAFQLECMDSGELIDNAQPTRMFEMPKELESYPVTVSHAEFDLHSSSGEAPLTAQKSREELARVLKEVIHSKRLVKLEVVKKSYRTPLSKLHTVRLHLKSQQAGPTEIYPDCVLSTE